MKNNAGFSLLEVIITISLAGAVLAVMSRTIKTGLEV
ncbi:MAG: prepilin-type N-terminal cleavage/methylation domain-containing protein, partial [Halanaerobium sp.]